MYCAAGVPNLAMVETVDDEKVNALLNMIYIFQSLELSSMM